MTQRLTGTVALVTGASSGIGEATAAALAGEGAAVAVVARRRDRLDTLAARIHSAGGRALVVEARPTSPRRRPPARPSRAPSPSWGASTRW